MKKINEIQIDILGEIFASIRVGYNNNEIIELVTSKFYISKEMILEHIEYLLEMRVIKKKKNKGVIGYVQTKNPTPYALQPYECVPCEEQY